MPHAVSNDADGPGVVITLTGLVKGDEIFHLNEALMADNGFVQWRYQIWDFSNIEKVDVSLDQMRLFAIQDRLAARKNPHQKIAIILRKSGRSGHDRAFHAMEKVWGAYESRSFERLEEARAWGLEDPHGVGPT
jgi:hypothetical protein